MYNDIIIIKNMLKKSSELAGVDVKTAFYGVRHDMPLRRPAIIVGPKHFSIKPKTENDVQYLNLGNDWITLDISIRIYAPKKEKGETLAALFEKVCNIIRKNSGFATEITCDELEFSTALAAVCLPCCATIRFLRAKLE